MVKHPCKVLRTKHAAFPKSSVAYHLSDIWSRCQLATIIINIMIIYVSESFFSICWKWQMLCDSKKTPRLVIDTMTTTTTKTKP